MLCSNCGNELANPAAKFCNKCGKAVASQDVGAHEAVTGRELGSKDQTKKSQGNMKANLLRIAVLAIVFATIGAYNSFRQHPKEASPVSNLASPIASSAVLPTPAHNFIIDAALYDRIHIGDTLSQVESVTSPPLKQSDEGHRGTVCAWGGPLPKPVLDVWLKNDHVVSKQAIFSFEDIRLDEGRQIAEPTAKYNFDLYRKVKKGMSLQQVEAIMKGKSTSMDSFSGPDSPEYYWKNKDGLSELDVNLEKGHVYFKSAVNLR